MLFSYSKTSLALVAAVLTSTLFAASAATSTTYDVASGHAHTAPAHTLASLSLPMQTPSTPTLRSSP